MHILLYIQVNHTYSLKINVKFFRMKFTVSGYVSHLTMGYV